MALRNVPVCLFILLTPLAVVPWAHPALGQAPVAQQQLPTEPVATPLQAAGTQQQAASPSQSLGARPATTTLAGGTGELPRGHGQVWREYDIRPYTSRVTSTAKPEQAVIDWILRETGTDVWFSEPVALLSANKTTVRVYHTPEMQRVVQDVIDRFVASRAESYVIGLRLVTVGSPNWRSRAYPMLRAVDVQTPGIEAWLLSKENAALLMADLRKRSDFRQHNAPNLVIQNGQSHTISQRRPRSFVRGIRPRGAGWSGYDVDMGQIDEGFSLQISPLFSRDGSTVDAVIKCEVDQVERFLPIPVDVMVVPGQTQRVQIQVPQVVSWRLHERFRWPADQVLLLSCGVVATPDGAQGSPLAVPIPLLPNSNNNPGRADALLFLESKGSAEHLLVDPARTANRQAGGYSGRY